MSAGLFFDRCELRADTRELLIDGRTAALGARAFDVLLALIERRDRIVAKNELLEVAWPGLVVEENNLQVQISALRKLLGPNAIATVPGRGYRFTAAIAAPDAARAEGSIVNGADAGASAARAAPVAIAAGNLPEALPMLYGRDRDVAALLQLIDAHRIVTIVGAGGIGKTRCAWAAAHAQRDRWADGVWLVELAACVDPALVPGVIAQSLGARLRGSGSALEEVVSLLRTRRLLLVLDNCEHLIEACAALAVALLAQAPGVRLLSTSQEPLNVSDEQLLRLQALAVPASADAPDARDAGAVALFAARARGADPSFALDAANLPSVIEICRRLDGIALAIELAAARVPLLGVEGLRARLDDRFRVLTAGSRVSLRRHQTLRATVEWSYAMLSDDEQAVLARLGVFAGSFGLEAAQRVGAARGIDEWAVLDHLGALVAKSLVQVEAGNDPRYRLLETTRAFAVEKLDAAGETTSTLSRHALATRAIFERSAIERWRMPSQDTIERYLPDLENLRAALDWAASTPAEREMLIGLTGAAAWLWWNLGAKVEGLRRCEVALESVDAGTPPALEARLQWAFAMLSYPGVTARVLHAAERSVALSRTSGDREALYIALTAYARVVALRREMDECELACREADALVDPSWPPALRQQAIVARAFFLGLGGDHARCATVFEASHRLALETNDNQLILTSMLYLEQSAALLGDFARAIELGYQIRERKRTAKFTRMEGTTLANLAAALTEVGRLDEAMRIAREAVPPKLHEGDLVISLDPFALLAAKQGRLSDAAIALGCVDAHYAKHGYARQPNEQREREVTMALLREGLAPGDLAHLLAQGAAMTDEEAARVALDEAR